MAPCGVSPAMFVGYELGYAVERRPIGSMSGSSAKLGSFESIGHVAVPVLSFRFPYGCSVAAGGVPFCPTARLCPVPTTPAQSHVAVGGGPPPVPPVPSSFEEPSDVQAESPIRAKVLVILSAQSIDKLMAPGYSFFCGPRRPGVRPGSLRQGFVSSRGYVTRTTPAFGGWNVTVKTARRMQLEASGFRFAVSSVSFVMRPCSVISKLS